MPATDAPVRLFHVSDVHFGAEDPAALAWFADIVAAEAPDAIVMTGDLTMRALPGEFAAGAAWLRSLGRPLTVEVGNHDLPYYSDPFRRLFRPYRRYAAVEAMLEQPLEIAGVRIVPLKTTARAQARLNWSKGRVSRRSLDAALTQIAGTEGQGLSIVACHHPLIDAGTKSSGRTAGGRAALAALAEAGATAVLSGHVHDAFDIAHRVGDRTIRLIGAGTLSTRLRRTRPSFNELRVAGRALDVVVRSMG